MILIVICIRIYRISGKLKLCFVSFSNLKLQVPSEGDVSVEKTNAKENIVLEGKRKRKKEKQVTTPRPACSWVYFR